MTEVMKTILIILAISVGSWAILVLLAFLHYTKDNHHDRMG